MIVTIISNKYSKCISQMNQIYVSNESQMYQIYIYFNIKNVNKVSRNVSNPSYKCLKCIKFMSQMYQTIQNVDNLSKTCRIYHIHVSNLYFNVINVNILSKNVSDISSYCLICIKFMSQIYLKCTKKYVSNNLK